MSYVGIHYLRLVQHRLKSKSRASTSFKPYMLQAGVLVLCRLFPSFISFCSVMCLAKHFTILRKSVAPPLLQAVTWSASISASFQIFVLLLNRVQLHIMEQFEIPLFLGFCCLFCINRFFCRFVKNSYF
jgi:hypothetical protein